MEEVQNFACDRCEYVQCIGMKPDGARCGKERRRVVVRAADVWLELLERAHLEASGGAREAAAEGLKLMRAAL